MMFLPMSPLHLKDQFLSFLLTKTMTTSPLSRFLDCMSVRRMSVKTKKRTPRQQHNLLLKKERARRQLHHPHPGNCQTCWKVSRYPRELRGPEMSVRYAWILLFTQSVFPVVISSATPGRKEGAAEVVVVVGL